MQNKGEHGDNTILRETEWPSHARWPNNDGVDFESVSDISVTDSVTCWPIWPLVRPPLGEKLVIYSFIR